MKTIILTAAVMLLAGAAGAQQISVTGAASLAGDFYNYTYDFAASGPVGTSISSLYLEVDDLNPSSVSFAKEVSGASAFSPTSAWTFLGYFGPNTLQFTSAADALSPGDHLLVSLSDPAAEFTPTVTHNAYGYDSLSANYTANQGPLVGPTFAAAVPEPGSLLLMAPAGGLLLSFLARRKRRAA